MMATRYVVRLANGLYAAPHFHWTPEQAHAERFAFASLAHLHAQATLTLEAGSYAIEAVSQ